MAKVKVAAVVRASLRNLWALSLLRCLACTMLWTRGGSFTQARATAMANWFYKHGNKEIGPIDEPTMYAWVRAGVVGRAHLIRSDRSVEWRRADECLGEMYPNSRAPDLLASIAAPYFESEGLCFFPVVDVVDGCCRISMFYQNRFSGHCCAEISLWAVPSFWLRSPNKKILTFDIDCMGGEYGVVSQFYGIKSRWQGRRAEFEIEGKASYPDGKGDVLRYEIGLEADRKGVRYDIYRVVVAIISMGHVLLGRASGKVCLALPDGVAEEVPEEWPAQGEILWTMDEIAAQQVEK